MLDDYHEDCGEATPFQYSVPNLRVTFGRARRNIGAPTDMRGPGAVPGLYATESAMNELADQLKIDPVQLRVLNEPKIDEGLGIPFSSRHLLECFELGAEKFGWSKRKPEVGSMKRDGLTLGWGMAGCCVDRRAIRRRGERAAARRRHGPRRLRHAGHRHRHVHDPRAACLARRPACRSTRSKWRSAIRRFRQARSRADRWRPASVVPAVFAGGRQRDRIAADASRRRRRDRRSRSASPTIWRSKAAASLSKADGPAERRAVRGFAPARQPAPGHRQRQVRSDVRRSEAEVLDALVRLSLRRSHMATGDRSAARQPRGDRHRCAAASSIRWPAAIRSRARS